MATGDLPAGFPQARYPWMDKDGYPTRDFLYLQLTLWNRTGGASGNFLPSIELPPFPVLLGDSDGSSDEFSSIPGPIGAQGPAGPQGSIGPVLVFDSAEQDEPLMPPPRTFMGGWFDEKGSGGAIGFVNGVDFTAGTSTTLTLSQPYGSQANLIVAFDTGFQGGDTYSLNGRTLAFTSAIPSGIQKVYVKGFLMPQ